MVNRKQMEFPQKVKPMIETEVYGKLNGKERSAALQLFEELYWADKEDGGNRGQLLLETTERIKVMEGYDSAKKFMSGLTDFSVKQFLEMDTSGQMYLSVGD